jgi:parallel beta-helix repeat protein
MKRKSLAVGIILLFIGTGIITTIAQNPGEKPSPPTSKGNTLYVGGSGPGNYTKIQDAINASSDGGTVFVYNGTYPGYVRVNKSISLIGENKNTTVIEGGWGSYVTIRSSLVLVTGFTVRDCGFDHAGGITISSDHVTIIGNILTQNIHTGIMVGGDYNLITNNSIVDNPTGVGLEGGSNNNTVTGNVIESSNRSGIVLEFYYPSSNDTIKGNIIRNNGCGIEIINGNNTLITNNIIINNSGPGIDIFGEWYEPPPEEPKKYQNNTIIKNNTIAYNGHGITLFNANNSHIYHNNFLKNGVYQAIDDVYNYQGINYWDNGYPSGGNYWSDYNGSDDYIGQNQDVPGSDGIGDTPYNISGFGTNSKDRYPLIHPFGPYPELDVSGHGGFGVTIEITNKGTADAFDIEWNATITGGLFDLIHFTQNSSIDTLEIGKSTSLTVVPFGIGPININVEVKALNSEKQTLMGRGFLVLFIVFPVIPPLTTNKEIYDHRQ